MDAIARRSAAVAEPLGPGCVAWQLAGDRTVSLQGASCILMQVAHPKIAAAVLDHSTPEADLVARLIRTIDSIRRLIYGGQAALDESQRLFEINKAMKGIDADGNRYHALHPEAYAWVVATLFDGLVRYRRAINAPISESDRARLYQDWRQVGAVLGLRPGHLPAELPEFDAYYETMIAERLRTGPVFHAMFGSLQFDGITASPAPYLPDRVWNFLRPQAGSFVRLFAIGLLRPSARAQFELDWTARDQRRLSRVGTTIRTVNAAVPARARLSSIASAALRN
ncbi:oxygenase MpaB family protein [Nocardia sp. NPDC059240]|uniref:oxygenase MpaB family protein n=1 Tax=Nocardia sp. NPDC059240 TaxID=3346786 RepID=UPI0036BF127C